MARGNETREGSRNEPRERSGNETREESRNELEPREGSRNDAIFGFGRSFYGNP